MIYIPVVNYNVFKHEAITWEWGVVFIEAVICILGIEFWKLCKGFIFFGRGDGNNER
jgi:Na+-exporting ATPase